MPHICFMILSIDKIIGHELVFLPETDSTNHQMQMLLKSGDVAEGLVIQAGQQIAGRGQMGKRWVSEPNQNILMSFVLYPNFLLPEQQFYISIAMSLGVHDFLSGIIENCYIKWPNDLMVGKKKIAGILIQNTLSGEKISSTVVGIGLNVNQLQFDGNLSHATSLRLEAGILFSLDECVEKLNARLNDRYVQLKSMDWTQMKEEYYARMMGMNQVSYYMVNGQTIKGIVRGVDENGGLKLEVDGQVHQYNFGEATYIY